METTLYKYCKHDVRLKVINTDTNPEYVGYGNGSGYPQGMLKIHYIRSIAAQLKDDDWVLSVDSDVVFCNGDVFDQLDLDYGIIGILGQQPWDTIYGKKNWAHMSGCLIFLRGDVAKQICSWSAEAFERIRQEQFKSCGITENEDVMLSYFAMLCAAPQKDISSFSGNNFEQDIRNRFIIPNSEIKRMKSFYHLNYNPEHFLGIKLGGAKWGIAGVLKQAGIEI
jgi:hypothetical protein